MTEQTKQKSIADFWKEEKQGMLTLVLEQLLAPDSPWSTMDGMYQRWGAYEHLTLEDFQRDCEWKEDWYADARYGISACAVAKRIDGVSTREEACEWAHSSRELPELTEDDLEEWFQENPPERSFRDFVEVRVEVSDLRLKDNSSWDEVVGQK